MRLSCVERNGCGWKAFGGGGEGDDAGGGGGAKDGDGVALVEFAVDCLEGIVVEEIAVVDGDDLAGAGGGEVDAGLAVGDDGVVGVDECGGDVGDVVPVWRECGLGLGIGLVGEVSGAEASGEEQARGFAGGAEFVLGDDFAVGAGDCFQGAGIEGNLESDRAGVEVEFLCAEGFVVEEEFHFFGVGVDFDVFGVRGLVLGSPVEQQRLAEACCWIDWGGGGGLINGGG